MGELAERKQNSRGAIVLPDGKGRVAELDSPGVDVGVILAHRFPIHTASVTLLVLSILSLPSQPRAPTQKA